MPKSQPSKWRVAAYETISNVIKSAPPGADLTELIDAAYPFGIRKYTPYRIWLQERKKTLIRLNLYETPGNRKCKYHLDGQTCLLCMNSQSL